MYLAVDEGAGVILLVDAVHPPHVALPVRGPGPDRLVEGPAPGAEAVLVIVVTLPAVLTGDPFHHHPSPICSPYGRSP